MGAFQRKYGAAATIDGIPLIVANGTDYKDTPTLAAGDAKVSKDGGALANLATPPAVTPVSSRLVRISLSSAEMTAARVVILFVDQTSPKQWEDQIVVVETYGHDDAAHAFDLDTAEQGVDAVKISGSTAAADDVELKIGNLNATVSTRGTLAKQTNLLEGQSYQNGLIAGLNDLSAEEVSTKVDAALNTAIPGSPTEHSINERVKAIDDKLPSGTISDFDESADGVNVTAVGGEAVSGPDDLKGTGVSVTLGAVVATPLPGNRLSSPMPFEMFRKEAKTFTITVQDADGKPVDLSAKTLRFVVIDSAVPAAGQFKIDAGANLVVSGDNNEVASVTISTTQSAVAHDDWHWLLWDTVADEVLAHGSFKITPAVEDVT